MSVSATAPSLPSLLVGDWQAAWWLDAVALLYAGAYLWGAARSRRWLLWRSLSFLLGVAVVLVALQSGLDAYDDRLLSAHMVQHILLLMLAPPLLLLGAPVTLALRALPVRHRRVLALMLARSRPLTSPGICLSVFFLVLLAAHVPAVFDATLSDPPLHAFEHLAFLAAGLLLWWPLSNADPVLRERLGGLGRVFYMLAAMVPEDLIGAYLNRANTVVYQPYAAAARALGISAVADQQQAGAIMWVASSCIMAAGGLWAAMSAMSAEERRARRREDHASVAAVVPPAELRTGRGGV
jgi:cytochrome c oxidase assembly factor CtaG